ncbi:MAG: hypothetical protein ACYCPM_09800 [Acidobacteriaceae bacterium]
MIEIDVQRFLRRAKDFEYSMKLCNDANSMAEVEFPAAGVDRGNESLQSAALLGIHAAISYADALRTALGDSELSAEDHQKAVGRLRQVLVDKKVEDLKGVQRFNALVGKKSAIAYGKKRTKEKELKMIIESSQTFSVWINKLGKQLNVEGWGDVATTDE